MKSILPYVSFEIINQLIFLVIAVINKKILFIWYH